jgi:hypothetical protein
MHSPWVGGEYPAGKVPLGQDWLTSDVVERVWRTVWDFPNLLGVQDWRTREEAHDQLRPALLDSL